MNKKFCASLILLPLSQDVPNPRPEKSVRAQPSSTQIICELLQPIQEDLAKRSPESRLPFLFLLKCWVIGSVSLQFPGACSSRRSEAGPGEDKSCNVDVEEKQVPELDDNPEQLEVRNCAFCM